MYEEKISNAVNLALKYLAESVKNASNTGKEGSTEHKVWCASSELEYALLLFSLMYENSEIRSSWKTGLNPKKEIGNRQALVEAQKALKEAKKHLRSNEWKEAYKATWTARNYIFRVQKNLEKERKEKLKAKATQKQ